MVLTVRWCSFSTSAPLSETPDGANIGSRFAKGGCLFLAFGGVEATAKGYHQIFRHSREGGKPSPAPSKSNNFML